MNILAFLTDRRPKGSSKGAATRKLLRGIKSRAQAYAAPSLVVLERKRFRPIGSPRKRERIRPDGIEETFSLSNIDDLVITMRGKNVNTEFDLSFSCDGDGSYDLLSIDGSLVGFARFERLSRVEIEDMIDEAERTGFMDAQEAMEERLGLP